MNWSQAALLWLAALVAGAVNSVAGGGSFFTFPSLVLLGIPPVTANATSSTALWPGAMAAAAGYRAELRSDLRLFVFLSLTSLVGSTAGALLLILAPQQVFEGALPWLMLVAAAVFTWGGRLTARFTGKTRLATPWLCALLLPVAIYGGYFGGGQGFMLLALLSAAGLSHVHTMNALKSVLAGIHNGVSVVVFVVAGAVSWVPAGIMMLGAIPGGYLGARMARKVAPARVRKLVVAVAWLLTAWFAWRAWAPLAR